MSKRRRHAEAEGIDVTPKQLFTAWQVKLDMINKELYRGVREPLKQLKPPRVRNGEPYRTWIEELVEAHKHRMFTLVAELARDVGTSQSESASAPCPEEAEPRSPGASSV